MNRSHPPASGLALMLACALGVLAMAPAAAQAQYFGGGWGYFDPGFGGGYGAPSIAAPGYDFGIPGFTPGNSYALGAVDNLGIPGFTPGNSYALGAIDSSPQFNMGLYAPGVVNNVAEWNGILSGAVGSNSEPRYRAKVGPKLRRRR